MRKTLVIGILLVSLIVTLGTTAGVALAEAGPFAPGDVLFPVQHYVEQQAFFRPTSDQRAIWFLDLLERRLIDLGTQAGTPQQDIAVYYFAESVTQVARFTARTSPGGFQLLQPRLLAMLKQSEQVIANLTPTSVEEQASLSAAHAKVRTFQTLLTDAAFSEADFRQISGLNPGGVAQTQPQINPTPDAADQAVDSVAVPFPAGSPGDDHAFFPLEGSHAVMDCMGCHTNGNYQGTATTCEACHAAVTPPDHYFGDCAACHAPTTWQDAIFDHAVAGATDCASCHSAEAPANHYPGQCSNCHSTSGGWGNVSFNHAGFTDCQSCHSAPANHYPGQCSSCHNPNTAWSNATFNHAGFTDCQSCHSAPANHYPGQCSSCHNPNTAWSNATFHHAGFTDCQSCHTPPGGHYGGQCSQCHNSNNWNFNHSGASDCRACHSAPGHDHPSTSAQCSQCHNTSDWDDAEGDEGDEDGGGDKGGGGDDDDDDD